MSGTVYLIGAGPGDPGLITVRGLELLRRAQVVVHDRLISLRLLAEAPQGAEIIDAGKETGRHALSQQAINALLVRKAESGKTVVRLKGGDPFLYGRGGEEAEALAAAGIPFEVVPGVSSALAVPAYAGIPVTHRTLSAGVRIMTGHRAKEIAQPHTEPRDTVIALMAVSRLPEIVRELIEEGWPTSTPAAVVERGTTVQQRTIMTSLEDVVATAREARVEAPATLVVGEVVRLRERIQWAEERPLAGFKTLVVNRGKEGLGLVRRLESLGAECQWVPAVQTRAPKSWRPVDAAIDDLSAFYALVFLSAGDVDGFISRLQRKGHDLRALTGIRLVTLQGSVADALSARGLTADLVVRGRTSRAVAAEVSRAVAPGKSVLLLGQGSAVGPLRQSLQDSCVEVSTASTFTTARPTRLKRSLQEALTERPDTVVLDSVESVQAFTEAALRPADHAVAVIGLEARRAARQAGLKPILTASGEQALVRGLTGWWEAERSSSGDQPAGRSFPLAVEGA
jgi:uroporphyrinogen III methyltransferase/synthase